MVPGDGTLSVTFQAHQNLTTPHVYVICMSHVPVDDRPLSAAVPKLQPPHSNLLLSVPLGPPNPDPAEGGHGPLSVSCAACQQDFDWESSGP